MWQGHMDTDVDVDAYVDVAKEANCCAVDADK